MSRVRMTSRKNSFLARVANETGRKWVKIQKNNACVVTARETCDETTGIDNASSKSSRRLPRPRQNFKRILRWREFAARQAGCVNAEHQQIAPKPDAMTRLRTAIKSKRKGRPYRLFRRTKSKRGHDEHATGCWPLRWRYRDGAVQSHRARRAKSVLLLLRITYYAWRTVSGSDEKHDASLGARRIGATAGRRNMASGTGVRRRDSPRAARPLPRVLLGAVASSPGLPV